jgi:hypothetical protein
MLHNRITGLGGVLCKGRQPLSGFINIYFGGSQGPGQGVHSFSINLLTGPCAAAAIPAGDVQTAPNSVNPHRTLRLTTKLPLLKGSYVIQHLSPDSDFVISADTGGRIDIAASVDSRFDI